MKLSQLCIDRPVLATVLSLGIVLFGVLSYGRLPSRYLPNVDPPVISVTTVYPGAAPEVVETSVTDPIEDQVNGIEGVKEVSSISREQVSLISIEFELGRDLDAAANDVRDRVARVRSDLPDEVNEPVVAKQDSDASPVYWLALYGEGYDAVELTTIADTQIVDRLAKVAGVATVVIAGERRYSMRIWLDNFRLNAQRITIADVAAALRRENVDIPSGRLESFDTEFTVRSLGELRTASGFENLVIQNVGNQPVRLRDVGRIEVGPEDVRKLVRFNGKPGVGLGIVKQSNANPIEVSDAIRSEIEALRSNLPPGIELLIAHDSSVFIRQSLHDVTRTIFEASILVILVIYAFLRSLRATLIPAVAIPVSVLGAFICLDAFGFTLNTLSLMGVTLAIGLVVDDAIVVLENIARWIELGHSPLEAARRGMQEISFAVVAATLSAVAVFLPLTFLRDTTGLLFREFAVTVAAALLVSGFVALTLSPALCALVLGHSQQERGFKAWLGARFAALEAFYSKGLGIALRRPLLFVGIGLLWSLLGFVLVRGIAEELIPKSDSSLFLVWTNAPEGSTIDYMDRYQRQVEALVLAQPEAKTVFSVIALGLGAPGLVNQGIVIAGLTDPQERPRSAEEVAGALNAPLAGIPGIKAFTHTPSALGGFMSSPVALVVEGRELPALADQAAEIERRIQAHGGFLFTQTNLYLNKPQLDVTIDRERASDLGVSVRDVASTLQILLGGMDLSTFKLEGETYNVMVQLDRGDRDDPRDILNYAVRGRDGELIPLSSVIQLRETIAPREIPHVDRRRSVTISSNLTPALAQGEAIEVVEAIARDVLPESGFGTRWTGEAAKFLESGNALAFGYALALLVVFLVLAGQFESFVHPLTILVAVALSFTGAILALRVTGTTLNIFSKIGLVMLVGLVTKNSILIVEFANQLREQGVSTLDAVREAARTRFRPILMTALATIVGIVPIALGLGAGGDARAPLGIAVVGGMLSSTLLTFFVVPAVYLLIGRLGPQRAAAASAPHGT